MRRQKILFSFLFSHSKIVVNMPRHVKYESAHKRFYCFSLTHQWIKITHGFVKFNMGSTFTHATHPGPRGHAYTFHQQRHSISQIIPWARWTSIIHSCSHYLLYTNPLGSLCCCSYYARSKTMVFTL